MYGFAHIFVREMSFYVNPRKRCVNVSFHSIHQKKADNFSNIPYEGNCDEKNVVKLYNCSVKIYGIAI